MLVGVIYERHGTRNMKYYRGLTIIMPVYIVLLLIYSLSNISFPLSLSFIAEMLILFSTISVSPFVMVLTALVSILLPAYFILAFQK